MLALKKTQENVKWDLSPTQQPDKIFSDSLDKALNVYCHYKKVLLVAHFNAKIRETCLDNFLHQHQLKSLSKDLSSFKNVRNPSCIDFILTKIPGRFFKTKALFTRLPDFHKLVKPVFKKNILKISTFF